MYKILTLNNISPIGLDRLPRDQYEVASEIQHPDAVLVRSQNMHGMALPSTLKAIGRAGAGVNNIPVTDLTSTGIPVFNAPGANANAVKELVIAGMLLASRNICQAWEYARALEGSDEEINKQAEAGKKQFVGFELPGRTLGVIGLGAIGIKVANAAADLGMNVIGFDPQITVRSAWQLSSNVEQALSLDDLMSRCDYISFHVPLNDKTRNMINADRIDELRKGVVILNFARDGVVDAEAVCDAIDAGKVHSYICDFPSNTIRGRKRVIALPHIGASTGEAEDNCAVMVVDQIRDYLEHGNITNSVNFPEVFMPRTEGFRIAIANANVPNMVGQISTLMANAGLNILDLLNKSRGEIAYTLADVDKPVPQDVIDGIKDTRGVLNVRVID